MFLDREEEPGITVHWEDVTDRGDRLVLRFPSVGAELSLGELSRGSFLPCIIPESSEIFVSSDHAYDLTLGKACRVDAMREYVRYLQSACKQREPGINWFRLEGVYNRVIWACACGIPRARMAEDLSNLRAIGSLGFVEMDFAPNRPRIASSVLPSTRVWKHLLAGYGFINQASMEVRYKHDPPCLLCL